MVLKDIELDMELFEMTALEVQTVTCKYREPYLLGKPELRAFFVSLKKNKISG